MKYIGIGRLCVCVYVLFLCLCLFLSHSFSLSFSVCVACLSPKTTSGIIPWGTIFLFCYFMYMNICLYISIQTMSVSVVDRKEGQIS